jgi:hypothetical protein
MAEFTARKPPVISGSSVLTAGHHSEDFFEESIRKIAASPKDFQRAANLS